MWSDSVQLQNSQGQSYSAEILYSDEQSDIAILKINDPNYQPTRTIPYVFRDKAADLGEDVFTLGYPRDEAVYGQGYLSSNSGYSGDTSAYQISIPLNPGNSGGPLLDGKGNVIGIVSGKQAGLDGTSFAIKTKTLLNTLEKIPDTLIAQPLNLTNRKNSLNGLPRTEQVKRIHDFVFLVKVF
jgi:serine protease Do